MRPVVSTNDIISYYTSSQWLYSWFWSPKSKGMHVGFWDNKTHSIDEAVDNENKEILSLCFKSNAKKILDAGCGVGSTAVYIGQRSDMPVLGISVVKNQVKQATNYAKQRGVFPRISFLEADFTKMPFPDETFDLVYGVESICHAYQKSAFLKEAYRVLKKEGKLIVADGFLKRGWKTSYEKKLYDSFCSSFVLNELIGKSEMKKEIAKIGFDSIVWKDRSINILETTKFYHKRFKSFNYISLFCSLLPFTWARAIVRNAKAGEVALPMLESGLGCYGIFIARK